MSEVNGTAGGLVERLRVAAGEGTAELLTVVRQVGLEPTVDVIVDELRGRSVIENTLQMKLEVTCDAKSSTRVVAISNRGPSDYRVKMDTVVHQVDVVDLLQSLFGPPEQESSRTLHGFLNGVHQALNPASYLEIGIASGASLALSRTRSVGIDPEFVINTELRCDVALYRQTSDDFFAGADPLSPFGGRPIDFAFVDGMHLFEYVLRDFINVERHAHWSSVIIFDDMLPRNVDEAARERHTAAWTGDVFKLIAVLQKYRPELLCLMVDTKPTGLLMVLGADSRNDTLHQHYDEIVRDYTTPDPQDIPAEILARAGALDPAALLDAPLWQVLRENRTRELTRHAGMKRITASLADTLDSGHQG